MKKIARLGCEAVYLTVLIVLVLGYSTWLGDMLFSNKLLFSRGATTVNMTDFMHFYMAGDLALNPATRAHLFDLNTQLEWQRAYSHVPDLSTVFYFELPPPTLLMLTPLAKLSPIHAYIAFVSISLASVLLCLVLSAKAAKKNLWQGFMFVFAAFAGIPAYFAAFHGQYSFLGLAFIALFFSGLLARKDVVAGIGLGMLFFRPQYQVSLGVLLLMQKKWTPILIGLALTLALYVAAGALIGFDNIINYPRTLWNSQIEVVKIGSVTNAGEECIRGLLSQFLPQSLAVPASTVFSLIAMFGSAWALNISRSELQKRLAIGIAIISMLLFGVHTHLHDWVIGTLAAWFAFGAQSGISLKSTNKFVRAWYCECLAYPFATWGIFLFSRLAFRSFSFDILHALLLSTLIAAFISERRNPSSEDTSGLQQSV
jgi:hypothetical protein